MGLGNANAGEHVILGGGEGEGEEEEEDGEGGMKGCGGHGVVVRLVWRELVVMFWLGWPDGKV